MVVADLHVHTTQSDGTLTLETIPAAARAAGVETVAVTDHDRIHPDIDEPVTAMDGIQIIHGIELRVETETQRLDLLGYGVRETEALSAIIEDLQADRIERARDIATCVERELDVSLDLSVHRGIGRPHIARAIDAADHPYTYADAFAELIGDDGPCYVSRDIPDFATGRRVLAEACDLVGLAHPLRYDNPGRALEYCESLDAVELWYPYSRDVDLSPVEAAIETHDLIPTGGSDAHGDKLGRAGLNADAFEAVAAHLSI